MCAHACMHMNTRLYVCIAFINCTGCIERKICSFQCYRALVKDKKKDKYQLIYLCGGAHCMESGNRSSTFASSCSFCDRFKPSIERLCKWRFKFEDNSCGRYIWNWDTLDRKRDVGSPFFPSLLFYQSLSHWHESGKSVRFAIEIEINKTQRKEKKIEYANTLGPNKAD